MANYYLSGNFNNTIDVILSLTETTNTNANTSTYSYRLYIYKKNNTGYAYSTGNHYGVSIGTYTTGDVTTGYSLSSIPVGGEYTLLSGTTSAISHNADGTGAVTVTAYVRQDQLANYNFSFTQSVEMTAIPRASVPTVATSDPVIGVAFSIYTNRSSSSFTHSIRYKHGNVSTFAPYIVIANDVGDSYLWTIPMSFIEELQSDRRKVSSFPVTIECVTYNGSTEVGSNTIEITVHWPHTYSSILSGGTEGSDGSWSFIMNNPASIRLSNGAYSYLWVFVTATFGQGTYSIREKSFGDFNYTFGTSDYAQRIPTTRQGTGTITITTTADEEGTIIVEEETKALTLTIPNSVLGPTLNSIVISDEAGYAQSYGTYISGYSTIRVTVNKTNAPGANNKSCEVTIGNLGTYSGLVAPKASESPLLIPQSTSGNITVSAKYKDSRSDAYNPARVAEGSTTFSVLKYTSPSITGSARRTNQSGDYHPSDGLYITVSGSVAWTPINEQGASSHNTLTIEYRFAENTASATWSGWLPIMSVYSVSSPTSFSSTFGNELIDIDTAYKVQIRAKDSFVTSGVINNYIVPSATVPIDVYPSATSGVGIGGVSRSGYLDVYYPERNYKNVYVQAENEVDERNVRVSTTGAGSILLDCTPYTKGLYAYDTNDVGAWILQITAANVATFFGNASTATEATNWTNAPIVGGTAASGYIRFPNINMQIAWKEESWTGAISTAWGSGYESTSAVSLGNWAAAFSEEPRTFYSVGGTAGAMVEYYTQPTASSAGSIYLVRFTTSSSRTWYVRAIGIGAYT